MDACYKQPGSTSTNYWYQCEPAENQAYNKPDKTEKGEREEYSSQTEQHIQRLLISQFCKIF